MKRREGMAGFYRSYKPGQVKDLDEAIEFTKHRAAEFGLLQVEVKEESTRVGPDGNFHVALLGRTQRSLDREAAEAKKAKEEKK